ncbi:capsular polysaccharide biosynthesis protein [Bradyrhizobium sp. GM7.3]
MQQVSRLCLLVDFESNPMAFGRSASPRSIAPTEPAASWEAPRAAAATPDNTAPALIKGSLTLTGAFSFLRENGRRILMLALALFALGVAVLMVLPVRYAATALVVVDPRELRVTTDQDVLPGIGQDAAALQSQIEIAKSDGFLRPLIEKLKIADDEDIAGGHTDMTRLLEKLRSRLDISRRGLTYVIAISFTSNSAERAAYYANAIAEAFVATQSRVRSDATDEAADWLKDRLKTLSERLRVSEDAVAAFRLEHKILQCRQGFHHPAIAGDRPEPAGLRGSCAHRGSQGALRAGAARSQGQCRRSGEAGSPEHAARAALDPERPDRTEEGGLRRPPS